MKRNASRWCLTEEDLRNLTPEKARDLIVMCFLESHKETLARTARKLGILPTDAKLAGQVKAAVRTAFREVDGDFENPTPSDLAKVVSVLARRAKSWGTPDDIIEFHKKQIGKVLAKLQEK